MYAENNIDGMFCITLETIMSNNHHKVYKLCMCNVFVCVYVCVFVQDSHFFSRIEAIELRIYVFKFDYFNDRQN